MSFLKLLSVLVLGVLVTAQHPPEGPSFDLNRHMQCRGCVLQGLQWCAKSSASDYDGTCIKITESCESGEVATTKAEGCPNDAPSSKRSCSLCVFDAYSWCQDRRFPLDEYAGHCVAAPNMSTPGQQQPQPPTPSTGSEDKPSAPQQGPEAGQQGSEEDSSSNPELDSAVCGEGARLILRPQGCATALNPPRRPDDGHDGQHDEDGKDGGRKHHWTPSKGAMIAFGVLKVALLVACLCCCCRKKCRQRCRERCHRWHHHYHGLPEQQGGMVTSVANPNGAAVAVNGGCSYVGHNAATTEEQQVQQAMAASAPAAPVNVMVNIPPTIASMPSSDRKDSNGVEMMRHQYPGAVYPSLSANRVGYMPVQTHPADN